jgi:hypothetical protein
MVSRNPLTRNFRMEQNLGNKLNEIEHDDLKKN